MHRILITGSRNWIDTDSIVNTLGQYLSDLIKQGITKEEITIVHGDCPNGADNIADWLAIAWNLKVERYPADWKQFGKSAGFIRNKQMVDSGVHICLAFRYNKSSGTTNTIELAKKANVPVILIDK